MRRSFRIAQKSFAAEAAALTTISDKEIRSWKSNYDFPEKSIAVKQIQDLLDKCDRTFGPQNKVLMAYDVFRVNLKYISSFAYHPRYLATQSKKAEEMMMDCQIHMTNTLRFSQEERLRFTRFYEFLKAYKPLVERVLAIHHPSHTGTQQCCVPVVATPVRRYPLRSNRGKRSQ
jgi:hypothetical protein